MGDNSILYDNERIWIIPQGESPARVELEHLGTWASRVDNPDYEAYYYNEEEEHNTTEHGDPAEYDDGAEELMNFLNQYRRK